MIVNKGMWNDCSIQMIRRELNAVFLALSRHSIFLLLIDSGGALLEFLAKRDNIGKLPQFHSLEILQTT